MLRPDRSNCPCYEHVTVTEVIPGTDPVRVVATRSAGAMQYSAYTPMASAVATRSPNSRLSLDQHLSWARGGLRLLDVGQHFWTAGLSDFNGVHDQTSTAYMITDSNKLPTPCR